MTCANCGTDNPAGAHFCGGCGTTLPDVPAAAPPPPPVPPTGPPVVPPPPVPPTAPPTQSFPQVPQVPPVPPIPPTPPGSDPTLVGGLPPVPPVPPDPTTTFAVPPPGGPPPGPATTPAKKGSKKSLLLGLLALLVVGAIVGTYLVTSGGDDDGGGGEARQIVLEPITQTLADDFAGNLDVREFDASLARVLPDVPPLGDGIASTLSARRASGDDPGLYGGSQDVGTCDVSQLVDFLTDAENEEKAQAWAEVQGIDVDEIEDFIADLTPVRLRFDTRVTNHGFDEDAGTAFEIQSVLESGTAVLVDDTGVPRVKCNCGNPLAEPDDVGGLDDDEALDADALVQNLDDAWDDFDPEQIVVVEAAEEAVDEFVLVDIETGDIFKRPVGTDGGEDAIVEPGDLGEICELLADSPTCSGEGEETTTTEGDGEDTTTTTEINLGTGDVQLTLAWPSSADLDLAVIDPTGDRISFSNPGPTASGGSLDVDQGSPCGSDGDSGVENIFWPTGEAPGGDYTVEVTGFSVDNGDCGGGSYVLTIRVAGQDDQVIEDSVGDGETDSFNFSV